MPLSSLTRLHSTGSSSPSPAWTKNSRQRIKPTHELRGMGTFLLTEESARGFLFIRCVLQNCCRRGSREFGCLRDRPVREPRRSDDLPFLRNVPAPPCLGFRITYGQRISTAAFRAREKDRTAKSRG